MNNLYKTIIRPYLNADVDYYKVSNTGIVFGKYDTPLTQYKNHDGYIYVTLSKDKQTTPSGRHPYPVGKIVAETFIANPYGYNNIYYLDGNKTNNCVDNLQWIESPFDTQSGVSVGKKCNKKLSERDIPIIRDLYFNKQYDIQLLVSIFKVHPITIERIIHYKTWKSI